MRLTVDFSGMISVTTEDIGVSSKYLGAITLFIRFHIIQDKANVFIHFQGDYYPPTLLAGTAKEFTSTAKEKLNPEGRSVKLTHI